jgi:hypothetical protein
MPDDTEILDFVQTKPRQDGRHQHQRPAGGKDIDAEEETCPAFGYLRGIRDRALAVEFRFLDGNCTFFPYSWLGTWCHNPSVGLLLKFTGDVVSLVLIRGSNLDTLVNQSINLTDRGLQRHRITFIREMAETEIRLVGEFSPTIDRIEVAEFDSNKELREWLKSTAPGFLRNSGG